MNASSRTGDQRNSCELSKGRRGDNTLDNSFVLDESWFVRPKKDLRSVQLLGVGNLDMASVVSLLIA